MGGLHGVTITVSLLLIVVQMFSIRIGSITSLGINITASNRLTYIVPCSTLQCELYDAALPTLFKYLLENTMMCINVIPIAVDDLNEFVSACVIFYRSDNGRVNGATQADMELFRFGDVNINGAHLIERLARYTGRLRAIEDDEDRVDVSISNKVEHLATASTLSIVVAITTGGILNYHELPFQSIYIKSTAAKSNPIEENSRERWLASGCHVFVPDEVILLHEHAMFLRTLPELFGTNGIIVVLSSIPMIIKYLLIVNVTPTIPMIYTSAHGAFTFNAIRSIGCASITKEIISVQSSTVQQGHLESVLLNLSHHASFRQLFANVQINSGFHVAVVLSSLYWIEVSFIAMALILHAKVS